MVSGTSGFSGAGAGASGASVGADSGAELIPVEDFTRATGP